MTLVVTQIVNELTSLIDESCQIISNRESWESLETNSKVFVSLLCQHISHLNLIHAITLKRPLLCV